MDLQNQRYTRSTTRTTVQNLQHKTQHQRKIPTLDQPSSHSQKAHVGAAIRPLTQQRNVLSPVQYVIIARRPGILRLLVCRKRRGLPKTVRVIFSKPHSSVDTVKVISTTPKVTQPLILNGCHHLFEVDTGAGDNFCSEDVWTQLGKPQLAAAHCRL